MSITLRQLSNRTDGSEIVRTRRLDADEAVIGRGDDCDIQLPDLAVRLRHARLTFSGGRMVVDGLDGARFAFNGKAVSRAAFSLSDPAKLEFGDFDLLIEAAGPEGDALITVARGEGAGRTDLDQASKLFSLRGGLIGKRMLAWVVGLVILAAAVAVPIFFFQQEDTIFATADAQWSTGHLSQAHAFLEDNCEACHQQAFVAVRDEACMTCHAMDQDAAALTQVSAQVKADGSPHPPLFVREHALHDRLVTASPAPSDIAGRLKAFVRRSVDREDDRCAGCHLEHQGPEKDPTGEQTVAMSDLPPGPTLREVHDCVSCHTGLASRLADTGLLDAPSWGRHPEFRPLVIASTTGGAARIVPVRLTQPAVENTGLVFPHALHLSGEGGVARMATALPGYGQALTCATCHQPQANGAGFAPINMERDCEACHSLALGDQSDGPIQLPHGQPAEVVAAIQSYFSGARPVPAAAVQPRRRPGDAPESDRQEQRLVARQGDPAAAARAVQTAFSPRGVCFDCHVVGAGGSGPGGFSITPVRLSDRYLARGTFDHRTDGHRVTDRGGPACVTCHAASTSVVSSDLLLPKVEVCATCHGKPEGSVPHPAGGECVTCHSFHIPTAPSAKPERPLRLVSR